MSISIVLVRPQMGENIGAAARVMQNFGLSDLRIVTPRDGWPNEKALAMAVHARPIVEAAQVFDSLDEALNDRKTVVATCSYKRDMPQPVATPRSIYTDANPDGMAILFGAERNGLEKPEIAYADRILTIPTAPENHSLNLAQAIAVVAYEYAMQKPPVVELPEEDLPASREELQGLMDHLEGELDASQFWKVEHRKKTMWINIRHMLQKGNLTSQEVRTWRGIIRSLREH